MTRARRAGAVTMASIGCLWVTYVFTGWYRSQNGAVTFMAAVLVVAFGGLAVALWFWRIDRHLKVVEEPGSKARRLQVVGVSYFVVGVVITVGIEILNSFHPLNPNRRAGLLGGSEGFILVGAALFLVGWNLRRKTRGILRP